MYSADLAGQVLDSLTFSSAVHFRFTESWLTIESQFSLISPDGGELALDPEPGLDPEALGNLLVLLHQSVVESGIDEETSTLTVRFANGAAIVAGPDPEYEAWELGRGNGDILVCGPGGL